MENTYTVFKAIGMNFNTYIAYNGSAFTVNGVCFSHRFYFTYSENGKDFVNNKKASIFAPNINENAYMAVCEEGVIITTDQENFVIQRNNVGYTKLEKITVEEFSTLHFNTELN